jgi:hypothetical protein
MRRITTVCCALLGLMAILTACEQQDRPAGERSVTAPGTESDKALRQDYLAKTWYDGDAYEYDTVSGSVDVLTGGGFTAHPASYPRGFVVSVAVPPGAVPTEYAAGRSFTITIKVPRWGTKFDSPDAACPVLLEPDGAKFLRPITIWLVLPDGIEPDCEAGYLFYNLERVVEDGVERFVYRDASKVQSVAGAGAKALPAGLPEEAVVGDCSNLIRCQVLHFSRWEVDDGSCNDPGCE